jgi:hypothetical protein
MTTLPESSPLLTTTAKPQIDSDSLARGVFLRANKILRAIRYAGFADRSGDSEETRLQFAALATVSVARANELSKKTKKALSHELGINNLAHVLAVGSSAWLFMRLFRINPVLRANQIALQEIEAWLLHYGFKLDELTWALVPGRYRQHHLNPPGASGSSE